MQNSENLKKLVLLEFTKELIKNSNKLVFYQTRTEVNKKKKEELKTIEKSRSLVESIGKLKIFPQSVQKQQIPLRVLRIPTTRLPPNLQYLKPYPTNIKLDLGKLNPLVNDPGVDAIECNKKDEELLVSGRFGIKKTGIILTEEEIVEIIDKFSKAAKIPYEEGIFDVAVGNLEFSAIYSEILGSKFIIRKLTFPQPARIY